MLPVAHEKPSHFTFLRWRCEGVSPGIWLGVFPFSRAARSGLVAIGAQTDICRHSDHSRRQRWRIHDVDPAVNKTPAVDGHADRETPSPEE